MIIGMKALLRASQAYACFLISFLRRGFALKALRRTLPLRFRYEGNVGLMVVGSHARGPLVQSSWRNDYNIYRSLIVFGVFTQYAL